MYHVLVVDDELPALRYVCSIIDRFAGDFHVIGTASSGENALAFLRTHTIDLLITDISMHGISGIELVKQARKIQPKIHVIIISGYGEFEYAQGAIQAGVDDYLLKPVSIAKLTALLNSLLEKMQAENHALSASILPAIACGQPCSEKDVSFLFGGKTYRFAYVRWGSLNMSLPKFLPASICLPSEDEHFQILRGRDADEEILLCEAADREDFLALVSAYMAGRGSLSTWTAIYTPSAVMIEELPSFIRRAITTLYQNTVIGRHQILSVQGGGSVDSPRLPASEIRQFSYFFSSGKYRMVQDFLQTLAKKWVRERTPVRQVWHIGHQILHQAASVSEPISLSLEDLIGSFDKIISSAQSYEDLMDSLYALLIENSTASRRRMSAQELYDYTAAYIQQNYARPLSMQSVCDEIGISQTYLSRLFRKYSDTTFNAYLTACRMEKAKQLLLEKPDFLLKDIAACVGYEDSSYFSKVFRQYTGMTPSQWSEKKE